MSRFSKRRDVFAEKKSSLGVYNSDMEGIAFPQVKTYAVAGEFNGVD